MWTLTHGDERERLIGDLIAKGIPLHDQAHRGDKRAAREAHEIFKVAFDLDPDNPRVQAYYGSCLAMKGRDLIDPNEKIKCALRGMKLLDGAILAAPDDVVVHTLRAFVNYRAPERYFNRTSVAAEEFQWLADRYAEDNALFSQGFYWEILYHLGKAHRNLGDDEAARRTWQVLIDQHPGQRHMRLLRAEGIDVGPLEGDDQADAAVERLIAEGTALMARALEGDEAFAERALQHFECASSDYPDHPLLEAYRGSSVSLIGRFAADSNAMFAQAIKAMSIIDGAVARSPDDVRVRLVRAEHCMRMPELFFRRTAVAIVDLEYVRDRGEGSGLTESERHKLLWTLGEAYWRLGVRDDAEAAWRALLELSPDPAYEIRIRERLERPDEAVVWPVPPEVREDDVELLEAIRLHDIGVQGSRTAAAKALERWQAIYEARPDDPLVRAYYGSATALTGRDAERTSEMFGKVIQGMIHLNFAVKADPGNAAVRRLRGYLCFHLPETMFHLTETAILDLEFVVRAYGKSDDAALAERRSRVLQDLAAAYVRLGREDRALEITSGWE